MPKVALLSPVAGHIKEGGNDKELVYESEIPTIDRSVDEKNQVLLHEYFQKLKGTKQIINGIFIGSMIFIVAVMLLFLFVITLLDAPAAQCSFAFVIMSFSYILTRIILNTQKRVRRMGII